MASVRRPAVAGLFYPDDPEELTAAVDGYLAKARSASSRPQGPIKALIAPHAGYIYSGPVAASAYVRLAAQRRTVSRVVLLGPAHRVAIRGLAAPSQSAFATPLGVVEVDGETLRALIRRFPQVREHSAAHAGEHSLEVHLPFLQRSLDSFDLVPLVVGHATSEDVAEVLDDVWDGPETLIVISSDLSHYHGYAVAQRLDRDTDGAILALDGDRIGDEQACGRIPIRGLLDVARRRGLGAERLDLRNSGDTAGPRDQVVGYGAWALA
jgi:AmmeMemoRadiSam system protein B